MSLEPISTAEAAQRLGVTATTVRRMIAAGRLQAVLEPRPQGARFRVLWNNTHNDDMPAAGPDPAAAVSEPAILPVPAAAAAPVALPAPDPPSRHLLDELTHLRRRVETAAQHRSQAWRHFEQTDLSADELFIDDSDPQPELAYPAGSSRSSARRPLWRRLWPARSERSKAAPS